MRGEDCQIGNLFSYIDLEARVPKRHPLRLIRGIVNKVLEGLTTDFEAAYSDTGRPGIAPEKLLRALLLQAFYGIRSERQLMEQLDFNILFRWFVGLGMDDGVWDATVFSKNRDRLLEAEISARFLAGIVSHKRVKRLLSRGKSGALHISFAFNQNNPAIGMSLTVRRFELAMTVNGVMDRTSNYLMRRFQSGL